MQIQLAFYLIVLFLSLSFLLIIVILILNVVKHLPDLFKSIFVVNKYACNPTIRFMAKHWK